MSIKPAIKYYIEFPVDLLHNCNILLISLVIAFLHLVVVLVGLLDRAHSIVERRLFVLVVRTKRQLGVLFRKLFRHLGLQGGLEGARGHRTVHRAELSVLLLVRRVRFVRQVVLKVLFFYLFLPMLRLVSEITFAVFVIATDCRLLLFHGFIIRWVSFFLILL